jgi:hypothetical protein
MELAVDKKNVRWTFLCHGGRRKPGQRNPGTSQDGGFQQSSPYRRHRTFAHARRQIHHFAILPETKFSLSENYFIIRKILPLVDEGYRDRGGSGPVQILRICLAAGRLGGKSEHCGPFLRQHERSDRQLPYSETLCSRLLNNCYRNENVLIFWSAIDPFAGAGADEPPLRYYSRPLCGIFRYGILSDREVI